MFLEAFRVEHTRELGSHKADNIKLERNDENINSSREMTRLSESGKEQNHSKVMLGLGHSVLKHENL